MSRGYRRSVNVEAIAPWVALSFILLLWWAGAKTVAWMRPRIGLPLATHALSNPSNSVKPVASIDGVVKESAVKAAPQQEPTLTANVSVTGADITDLRSRGLTIPVKDVPASALMSSFNDARSGHRHEAIDILALRGTEVLAVEDGTVAKLFTSDAGGLTVYQFDPSAKYAYYYAHLDSYASGVKEGDEVKRGDVIGYVGTTGNAPKDTPHLHFAIAKLGPDHRWWEGTALDPFLVWRDPVTN